METSPMLSVALTVLPWVWLVVAAGVLWRFWKLPAEYHLALERNAELAGDVACQKICINASGARIAVLHDELQSAKALLAETEHARDLAIQTAEELRQQLNARTRGRALTFTVEGARYNVPMTGNVSRAVDFAAKHPRGARGRFVKREKE